MAKKAEIILKVDLDDDNIPEKIAWQATDAAFEGEKEAGSFQLAIWDKKDRTTLNIDLWAKEMTLQDMNVFFYQQIVKMAETFDRATPFNETAKKIRSFADDFAQSVDDEMKKLDKQNG